MDKQLAALATWAARMIREQDEFCRSQVPGYGGFSQEEMRSLKALEALASGQEPDARDYKNELRIAHARIAELREALDEISDIVGDVV